MDRIRHRRLRSESAVAVPEQAARFRSWESLSRMFQI